MARRFISRKGEWFDEGTEAILLPDTEFGSCGLFSGIRQGRPDEEHCGFDEFDIIETEETDAARNEG